VVYLVLVYYRSRWGEPFSFAARWWQTHAGSKSKSGLDSCTWWLE
jgi:hypothetical protein